MSINAVLAVAIPVVVVAIIFLVRKFIGINTVNTAANVIAFIRQALLTAGITTENSKFDDILDYTVKALMYISSACDSSVPTDTKVAEAIVYIKSLASEAGIIFDDEELKIISGVLTSGFAFVSALGTNSAKLGKMFEITDANSQKRLSARRN